jgi:hypothetical protein
MPVAVYKLRIRDRPGDDSAWQEARVVANGVAEALVQAQQRFGEEYVMAIEQDTGEPATDADIAAHDEPVYADAIVARPVPGAVPAVASMAHDAHEPTLALAGDIGHFDDAATREPMPWEGRWRPSVLLWSGIVVGLVLFALWVQFGAEGRERFVTASSSPSTPASGLALDQPAPSGGVLAAAGLRVRPDERGARGNEVVDEAVAEWAEAADVDEETAGQVRDIGNLVGDMFTRYPTEPASPPDAPPYRASPDDDVAASMPGGHDGVPPALATHEPSVLRPFFVEVERGDGSIETLRVTAYDADHARAIVTDLPERPMILRGPSPRLDW